MSGGAEGVPDDVPHGEGERDGGLAAALLPHTGGRRRWARTPRPALLQRRDAPGAAARRGRLDRQRRQLRRAPRGQSHSHLPMSQLSRVNVAGSEHVQSQITWSIRQNLKKAMELEFSRRPDVRMAALFKPMLTTHIETYI
jgi:hypothetical protein